MAKKNELSVAEIGGLLEVLKSRFEKFPERHVGLDWKEIQLKLDNNQPVLWSIYQMEKTGGEPDVIGYDQFTDSYIFCDCSAESPKERRSLCYDKEALDKRKENKPRNSAVEMAKEMGIELLNGEEYHQLQSLGNFDLKTSSWLKTPTEIRNLGGAIFGDKRYNHVFVYHNGAESYYAARGFRGIIKV